MTQWHVGVDEASALVTMLDELPGGKEDQAPVTLDLTSPVVIRARGDQEKRCTDLALPRSSVEGKALRVATDRRFLQRALDLGFHTIQITALDKPMLCQDEGRLYLWVPLDPKHALAPQTNALRVMLPAPGDKSRRIAPAAEPAKRSVPAPTGSRNPVGAFGGFFACARSLWDLVRKHHQEEQVK